LRPVIGRFSTSRQAQRSVHANDARYWPSVSFDVFLSVRGGEQAGAPVAIVSIVILLIMQGRQAAKKLLDILSALCHIKTVEGEVPE